MARVTHRYKMSDQESAEAVGVHRTTVTRWRRYHPAFQATLNQRRRAFWAGAVDRLRALVPQAIGVLEEQLEAGDKPLQGALTILKLAKIKGPPSRLGGETEPMAIVQRLATARRGPTAEDFYGLLPVTEEERLEVLDILARLLREDKRPLLTPGPSPCLVSGTVLTP